MWGGLIASVLQALSLCVFVGMPSLALGEGGVGVVLTGLLTLAY